MREQGEEGEEGEGLGAGGKGGWSESYSDCLGDRVNSDVSLRLLCLRLKRI